MSEQELLVLASRYFSLYPERDKLYVTSDGNVFLDKNPAIDHARKAVIKWYEVTRGTETNTAETDLDPDLQMKEQLEAEALTIDPVTGDYRRMLTILSGLHLMPESKKKADVQEAFTNLKAQLEAAAETPAE